MMQLREIVILFIIRSFLGRSPHQSCPGLERVLVVLVLLVHPLVSRRVALLVPTLILAISLSIVVAIALPVFFNIVQLLQVRRLRPGVTLRIDTPPMVQLVLTTDKQISLVGSLSRAGNVALPDLPVIQQLLHTNLTVVLVDSVQSLVGLNVAPFETVFISLVLTRLLSVSHL